MSSVTSSWVNRPPAWRWLSPSGPRASLNPLWPAASTSAVSSRSWRAVAGGPDGWPKAMVGYRESRAATGRLIPEEVGPAQTTRPMPARPSVRTPVINTVAPV